MSCLLSFFSLFLFREHVFIFWLLLRFFSLSLVFNKLNMICLGFVKLLGSVCWYFSSNLEKKLVIISPKLFWLPCFLSFWITCLKYVRPLDIVLPSLVLILFSFSHPITEAWNTLHWLQKLSQLESGPKTLEKVTHRFGVSSRYK